MAKFNISVDLDLFDEETGTSIDELLKDEIIKQVTINVTAKVSETIDSYINTIVEEQKNGVQSKIDGRLSTIIEDFLTKSRTVTDKWGDKKTEFTVEEMIKTSCDNYIEQLVDEKTGSVGNDNWNKKVPRVQFLIGQAVDSKMKYAIDRAIEEIKKGVVRYVDENIKTQIGENVAKAIGIDKIKL